MSSARASLLFTVAVTVFAAPAWGDEGAASAAGPAGPVGPADKYKPVTSGELFDTAQTLAKGQRQIRLSTRFNWGVTDKLQLNVHLVPSLFGPDGGAEYQVWSKGHSAASVAFQGQTAWNFGTRTGTALGQYTLGVGEWDRLNLQLGYGQGKVDVATGLGNQVEVVTWRTVPLKVSFDKVKSDRRVFRYNAAIDAGPLTTGGTLEAEGGVLWTYGFNSFRLSLGGGLRYAPSLGDRLNAALITAQQDPIDFPNVLPKLDANLWWTW